MPLTTADIGIQLLMDTTSSLEVMVQPDVASSPSASSNACHSRHIVD